MGPMHENHTKTHTAKAVLKAGLDALALVTLARRIGAKRLFRVAALATEGYVGRRHRSRRHG